MDVALRGAKRRRKPRPPKFNGAAFGLLFGIAMSIAVEWPLNRWLRLGYSIGQVTVFVVLASVVSQVVRERIWWPWLDRRGKRRDDDHEGDAR